MSAPALMSQGPRCTSQKPSSRPKVAGDAPIELCRFVAAEWGYGLRGVNADGTRGTHVIRVSAFKIF